LFKGKKQGLTVNVPDGEEEIINFTGDNYGDLIGERS
jgi:hypothetical protein